AILAALVGFDTTSRNSNLPLLDWVEDYLSPYGATCERVFDETGTKANLFATLGPDGAEDGGIILSGHTDTVPVDGQTWQTDPFSLTAKEGKLYGRGTCDMKGFLAACLAKVPAMAAAPLARPIHLAFSYDEEVGCLGVIGLVEALGKRGAQFEACFVGEPTQMDVVTAHKSKRSFTTHFRGLTCHSSLAPLGVNAVAYGAKLVAAIDQMADAFANGPRDDMFDMPVSTAHVGVFNGGTALNIVPAEATIDFEFRVLPTEDIDAAVDTIRQTVAEIDAQMSARDPSCGVSLEELSAIPGLNTAPEAEVTALAKRLAGRNAHTKVAFGTEAGRFHDGLSVPSIVVGPGSIDQAHKADEFIAVEQLRRCEAFIDNVIGHQSQ
ncbi:MAG: acetylornithine deacetylase, partial [Pseudomonadota bacterium]